MSEKIPVREEQPPSAVPKTAPNQWQQPAPSTHSRVGSRQLVILFVLALSLGITIIDVSIVNVALPTIQKAFSISVNDLEWISSLYALIYGAFILTWGKLSDQYGRRRIFMMGISLFIVGSAISGFSNDLGTMLIGRTIQGFGAAMAIPSTLSILTTTFVGKARALAFGIWGATAGATGAIGPVLGGYFVTYVTWRWAFLINVPIGIIAIIGAFVFIKETKFKNPNYKTDFAGIVLTATSLSALIFGLIEGQTYGWLTESQTFSIGSFTWPFSFSIAAFSLIAGSVLFLSFVAFEIRLQKAGKDPLFDFSLLKSRGFGFGNLVVLIVAIGEFGVLFFLSLYLQIARDMSAINTGLTILPLAIAAFFAGPLAAVAANKIGPKWVVTTGMVLEAVALFSLWHVVTVSVPIYYLYPVLVVYGVGIGLDIGQLTNTVLSSVPWQKAGEGSGINNTVRQVGSAFGVAIIGAVLVAVMASVGTADLNASTIIPEAIKPHLQTVLNNGLSGGIGATSFPSGSGAISQAITNVFDDALTQGTKWAAFTAGAFVSLGAICSLFLSNVKQQWGGGGGDSASWAEGQAGGQQQGQQGSWGGQQGQGQQWAGQQQGQQQGSWGGQQQGSWGGAEKPKSQDTLPSQEVGDKPDSSSEAGEEKKGQDPSASHSG
jgi:EmrB/QacA subfamily drug resistance transporter